MAPVPRALYHAEWERRRLRNIVHLTVGGCLGPCALANVAMLLFDGRAFWFHSINTEAIVLALYDYVETMLDADGYLPPPPPLAALQFTATTWQPRPDGAPVDDHRQWQKRKAARARTDQANRPESGACPMPDAADRLVADMAGPAAAPRRNGELVFEEPWQGRAFGMAVALNEGDLYPWNAFRERLIAQIASAEARDEPSGYYERWLTAFESLLTERGVLSTEELDERTFEFEFGERDEVF